MKSIKLMLVLTLLFGGISFSFAQKSTEMYIPLGQSPGLSGKYTLIGTIEAYHKQDSILTISTDKGSERISLKGKPKIWLDYNKLRLSNKKGSYAEFKTGLRVELKFLDHENPNTVDWIKVEMQHSN